MRKLIFLAMVFVCANTQAQKAAVKILDNVLISLKELTENDTVYPLENGDNTPEGYRLIARGKWWSGPGTVHCDKETFIDLTEQKARTIGARYYRLYDFKEPIPFLNTCYRSKVLFFTRQ